RDAGRERPSPGAHFYHLARGAEFNGQAGRRRGNRAYASGRTLLRDQAVAYATRRTGSRTLSFIHRLRRYLCNLWIINPARRNEPKTCSGQVSDVQRSESLMPLFAGWLLVISI